jgi:hypothetical protein
MSTKYGASLSTARATTRSGSFVARSAASAETNFLLGHRVEDNVAAFDGAIRMRERAIGCRALDHARDQGRLLEAEIGDVLAEEQRAASATPWIAKRSALARDTRR